MEQTTINFIAIFPRTPSLCAYSINGNSELHAMSYDNIRSFLSQYLKGNENILTLNEFLSTYRPFFIDVESQTIEEIEIDKKMEWEQIKTEHRMVSGKDVEKKLQPEKQSIFHSLNKIGSMAIDKILKIH